MAAIADLLPAADGTTLLIALSALAAGLARGFSGFGTGMIFLPVASALYEPRVAAAAILVTDGILTLPHVLRSLPRCDRRSVAPVALAAVLLIPVGAWLLAVVDPTPMRWAIAGIIALLLVLMLSRWRFRAAPTVGTSLGVGALAGFLSGFTQLPGPPVIALWLASPVGPATVRANIFVFFGVTSVVSVVTYAIAGLFTAEVVAVILAAIPLYAAGLYAGGRLFHRSSERVYRALAIALIAVSVVIGLPVLDPLLR